MKKSEPVNRKIEKLSKKLDKKQKIIEDIRKKRKQHQIDDHTFLSRKKRIEHQINKIQLKIDNQN